jgi:Lrp/AsnC family transcriptional regulator for asnA, asnC and gidA
MAFDAAVFRLRILSQNRGKAHFSRQQVINSDIVIYVVIGEAGLLKLKNNALFLDSTDLLILQALQDDSRQTYTAIGKRLGIAHSTVYDRIKRMEQNRVITKYTTVIDSEKMGATNITALMTVYTDPKETEKVAARLAQYSETREVYTSFSEELLVLAKVSASSQESLHAFIANCVAPLRGVLRIRTSVVTRKLKETQFSINNNSTGNFIK